MSARRRVVLLSLAVVAMTAAGPPAQDPAAVQKTVFLGACYCKAGATLQCTANLTEPECRRRCDEALCDDWYWKERLPCWNWGYGG